MHFKQTVKQCGVAAILGGWLLGSAVVTGGCDDGLSVAAGDNGIEVRQSKNALCTRPVRDWRFNRLVYEGEVTGADDASLRYKQYEHIGRDSAVVLFLGGFADFVEKYEFLFTAKNEYPGRTVPSDETLADLPITFFSLDQVGHGKSDGLKSHIDDFDTYVENVKAMVDRIRTLKGTRLPLILMSHSMGGLEAARFAETYSDDVDGLIFSSPMWGIQEPPGVPTGMLRPLADFYVAAGLNTLCATPLGIDPTTLAAIAICQSDPTLSACFNNPSQPMCSALTMCLLQGQPNNCGLPPIDFAGLNALFQSLYMMPQGCSEMPDAEAICTVGGPEFQGTTSDFDFCVWSESHPLAGPQATFGWLSASYQGIDDMTTALSAIDMPTLVLTSPIDPIVIPETHTAVCGALPNCTLVPFISNPDEGLYYFHQLLAETDHASVIAAVRQFLTEFTRQ
jgi:alpha-beta hydrolase superfamily lysophospholipase